eukprot:3112815-Pyramimonas_sp.AAC.1
MSHCLLQRPPEDRCKNAVARVHNGQRARVPRLVALRAVGQCGARPFRQADHESQVEVVRRLDHPLQHAQQNVIQ